MKEWRMYKEKRVEQKKKIINAINPLRVSLGQRKRTPTTAFNPHPTYPTPLPYL